MKYQRLDGTITNQSDEKRGLWYSSCGYWTDDWTKLKTFGPGIPCCPVCGCPGYQTTWEDWFRGAKRFENGENPEGIKNPWYCKFLLEVKETCGGRDFQFLKAYWAWKEQKGI